MTCLGSRGLCCSPPRCLLPLIFSIFSRFPWTTSEGWTPGPFHRVRLQSQETPPQFPNFVYHTKVPKESQLKKKGSVYVSFYFFFNPVTGSSEFIFDPSSTTTSFSVRSLYLYLRGPADSAHKLPPADTSISCLHSPREGRLLHTAGVSTVAQGLTPGSTQTFPTFRSDGVHTHPAPDSEVAGVTSIPSPRTLEGPPSPVPVLDTS